MILSGYQPGFYLTLPDAKASLLGDLGVDLVVTHPFNDDVRRIRAAEFVGNLLAHLKMAALWVGADFAMGYQREGNVAFLGQQAAARGFELRVVDLMDAGGERVSSSRVRDALNAGDVAEAGRLLGRAHRVPGQVVEGARRGHTLGFPTANLAVADEQAVPARGVYAGWAMRGDTPYPAVINIGVRPTFDGTRTLTIEAHLLDFDGDLYGHQLTLDFVERLRDEQRFDGVAALVAQINDDIARARILLGLKQSP
jgi:riboflavin kinase/FMN adenylyltransferase